MQTHSNAWVLLFTTLMLVPEPSWSANTTPLSCWEECVGSTCISGSGDYCSTLRNKCSARCNGRRWWGAIAYSKPDGIWGASWGWTEVDGARERAVARCKAGRGAACKVMAVFEDECGAVAADGNFAGWGSSYVQSAAYKRAVLECRKAGGTNCAVRAWACSKMMDVTDAY